MPDIAKIHEILTGLYPDALCSLAWDGDSWRLLVMGVLSAQCTDARVNLVTPALFARYPDVRAMAMGDAAEIGGYIHSCGFWRVKSENLHAAAVRIVTVYDGQVPDTMEELLERSDMVNINVPLVPSTKGMISRAMFDHFKPGAVFVNAARGAVIDEDALYDALVSGKLKAAACDTFVNEPPTGENKLLSLPNFSATPHIGGNTNEALEKAGMEVVTETLRVLNGEKPIHPVHL